MEKKLKELLQKKDTTEQSLKEINDAVQSLKIQLVKTRGQGLFKSIIEFANIFKTGVVAKKFEAIRQELEDLKAVDANYLHTIGTADPYGMEGDEQLKYIVPYLLSSKWREDSDLWGVLGQISDTIDMKGNPFAKDGE